MAAQAVRSDCEDCVKKNACEYKPSSGTVLRCLDKQTDAAARSKDPYAEAAAGA